MKKDVVRFEIWNLLWFHFSSITLFSLATGIKYSKYKDEAYNIWKPRREKNEAYKSWASLVLIKQKK